MTHYPVCCVCQRDHAHGALAGDKPRTFVGSRQWIGAIELGYVLDALLGVTCRVVTVASGGDMATKARELARHFDRQARSLRTALKLVVVLVFGPCTASPGRLATGRAGRSAVHVGHRLPCWAAAHWHEPPGRAYLLETLEQVGLALQRMLHPAGHAWRPQGSHIPAGAHALHATQVLSSG